MGGDQWSVGFGGDSPADDDKMMGEYNINLCHRIERDMFSTEI